MRLLAVLVLALALVAAGCAGDDESTAGDATTVQETTNEDTKSGETTDGDLSGGPADEDCQALAAAAVSFFRVVASAPGTPEQANALQELADTVPDELAADALTIAELYGRHAQELLADVDLDVDLELDLVLEAGETPSAEKIQAALPQLHAVLAQLQALLAQTQAALAPFDAAAEASERISAWAQENCPSG